jgi:cobaltochelatase CobS
MMMTPTKTNFAEAWRMLNEQMSKRPNARERVQALANERHQQSLETFHASTADEDAKLTFYRECMALVLNVQRTPFKTAQELFDELCKLTREVGGDTHKKIAAHLRAVTGKAIALAVYHHDRSITDGDKVKLYNECIAAIKAKDFSGLAGKIGAGDKRAEEEKEKAAPSTTEEPPETTSEETVAPPARGVKPVIVADEGADELAQAIIRTIAPHLKAKSQVDEPAVRKIASEVAEELISHLNIKDDDDILGIIRHAMGNGEFPEERVKDIFKEMASGIVHRIEFVTPKGETKLIDGLVHPQVPQIATWLKAGVPTWAWSAAGSGKTHMARQIATMLGVDPHVVSVDPTLTVAKLMGYRNVANGDFVEGFVYKPFKSSGLLAFDEIDTGDPGVIASSNALLSNAHYLFPNNETVARHEQFYTLAMANTKGMGAVAGYTARNRLDAATLDRFAVIEIKYDAGLESALACGVGAPAAPWKPGPAANVATQQRYVEWVQKVRKHVETSVLVSPRASINGCKALRCGVPLMEVVDALVFKLVTDDTRKRIIDSCGLPAVAS